MNSYSSNYNESEDFSEDSFDCVETRVVIIGAGCAGLYSAYCCSLANVDCILIESLSVPGGQCSALYPEKKMFGAPGYSDIKAKDFVKILSAQCLEKVERKLFGYRVETIDSKPDEDLFVLKARSICSTSCSLNEITIYSKYIIIATGIGDMKPNIPQTISGVENIAKNSDFIQFSCLNLSFYKGKTAIIAGGGDSAIDFAIDIAGVAKGVTIIHRRNKFTCEPHKLTNIERLVSIGKINLVLENNITELIELNNKRIVKTKDTKQIEHEFETDHIVFCYGFVASLGNLFGLKDLGLKTDNNLILVDINTMETSIKNCYAAGDIVTYANKKKNIIPSFFEADRAVRSIKDKVSRE